MSLEQAIYPQLGAKADVISRGDLDTLRGFKSDIKALSKRIGRVRQVGFL